MNVSTIFSVTCPYPDQRIAIPAHLRSPDLVTAEETGSLWLWAFPELLGWPAEISWLFSPVTGKSRWPGDLWGLDTAGNLLIVETKVARARRGKDPFEDFVGFENSDPKTNKGLSVFTSPALHDHWHPLFQQERQFVMEKENQLRQGIWDQATYPGIVPYSYKRVEVWRWREVYLDTIAKKVMSQQYEKTLRKNLQMREAMGTPHPHYIGFFTVCSNAEPRLSAKGLVNYNELCKVATSARVHLLAAKATEIQPGQVRISSWRVE